MKNQGLKIKPKTRPNPTNDNKGPKNKSSNQYKKR